MRSSYLKSSVSSASPDGMKVGREQKFKHLNTPSFVALGVAIIGESLNLDGKGPRLRPGPVVWP